MRIDAHGGTFIHTRDVTEVARRGNSLVLRLPRGMARQIDVDAGRWVEILAEGDRIIVRSAAPRWTLDDMLTNMTPEAMGAASQWREDSGREQIDD